MSLKRLSLLILVSCAIVASGCVKQPRVPIYADPGLSAVIFDTVTVLPVVDRRVDKSAKVDLEKRILNPAKKLLKKQGYEVIVAEGFSQSSGISNEAVAEMETAELAELGPSGTKMMLILYLEDASAAIGFGASFKGETSASLIDKPKALLLWKDKAVNSQGQGGLIGCLMANDLKNSCLQMCVTQMLSSFPLGPKKRGK